MTRPITALVIACVAMTVFTSSNDTEAKGFFDSIFGPAEDVPAGPPPEKTLQAPFPTESNIPASHSKLMTLYDERNSTTDEKESDLSKPHRNEKQIVEWATEIASQAMTINLKSYETDFKKFSSYFTPYALQEYNAYLSKTNMMNVLSGNSYRLQSMSNTEGTVTKSSEITGTYHWLVQVPLMMSFYGQDVRGVEKTDTVQNNHIIVQMQIGRIPPRTDADGGLVVERWNVSSNGKN